MHTNSVHIRHLGLQDYHSCWQAMREFTDKRNENTQDEIWLLEHPPVFTQGQNGKAEHILNSGDIPVVPIDRGGQITYHGPGQLVAYTLIDIKRKKLNIREFVTILEKSIINTLLTYNIQAASQCKAPGVYVDNKKICSIGLRVRRGCSYHGLALNVDMDLEPFSRINPCGFSQLKMTQITHLAPSATLPGAGAQLIHFLSDILGYTNVFDHSNGKL
jgi:lipoyl(octanoyl) transferase